MLDTATSANKPQRFYSWRCKKKEARLTSSRSSAEKKVKTFFSFKVFYEKLLEFLVAWEQNHRGHTNYTAARFLKYTVASFEWMCWEIRRRRFLSPRYRTARVYAPICIEEEEGEEKRRRRPAERRCLMLLLVSVLTKSLASQARKKERHR